MTKPVKTTNCYTCWDSGLEVDAVMLVNKVPLCGDCFTESIRGFKTSRTGPVRIAKPIRSRETQTANGWVR